MEVALRLRRVWIVLPLTVAAMLLACGRALGSETAADLGVVTLFDGERGETLNTWGGGWGVGSMRTIEIQSAHVHSGRFALGAELGPTPPGGDRCLQCFASGFGPSKAYCQTRDLSRFARLEFYVQNAAHAALNGTLQVKDYHDSSRHRAVYRFYLPASSRAPEWQHVVVPLSTADPGWTTEGHPDFGRVLALDFIFSPETALSSGQVFLDDIVLVERGGPLNIDTAPLPMLVERMAHRQWDGLWAARSRTHGLIPNTSYESTDAGLNATAAVLWMLPAAIRHQWVPQAEADRYVAQLVETIGRLQDRAKCVPPRNVDWATLEPSLLPEESAVDAAFLALALHQYKSLPSTPPALRKTVDETQNRFNFAAFACPSGWRMAYRYATRPGAEGFLSCTYDGYTNEGSLISLAAHLAVRHHVPIEKHWNSNVHRVRGQFAKLPSAPVVHSLSEFRAPFAQALLNLFVDVRSRGPDRYPDNSLAVNPWQNFVCYEQQVMARLAELGRPYLVEPDAGDDGTLRNYQQFSLYNDFGERDLFMPWSAAFPLLAGADGADTAVRFLLRHKLHGPLGLADSAMWATGADEPHAISARNDFWNTGMGTMAMLEWLDGSAGLSKSFAALPEVRTALDQVFLARADGAGQAAAADKAIARLPTLDRTQEK